MDRVMRGGGEGEGSNVPLLRRMAQRLERWVAGHGRCITLTRPQCVAHKRLQGLLGCRAVRLASHVFAAPAAHTAARACSRPQ